jgi:hypothetical protein
MVAPAFSSYNPLCSEGMSALGLPDHILRLEFHHGPFAPAILAAGESRDLGEDFSIVAGREHASACRKALACHSNRHPRISAQVLQPVRGIVFRDDVVEATALGKPDFDFPGKAGLPSARGQIEVWFLADVPDP